MSMMCPPQRVKTVSTPSFLSARATKCPPETIPSSRLFCASVSCAVADGFSMTVLTSPSLPA